MILFKTIWSFLRDKEYRDLLLTTFVTVGVGSAVYHFVEKWSWIDSIYFSVITLTTVGYGDFFPKTDFGKLFTVLYIIIGIGIILAFIEAIYNHYDKIKKDKKK